MAIELRLPELGENIESGTVIKVLVSVGDTVEVDQPVLEIETGKAALEVPSTAGGAVTEVHAKEGDTLNVGDLVLTLSEDKMSAAAPAAEPEAVPQPEPEPMPAASSAPALAAEGPQPAPEAPGPGQKAAPARAAEKGERQPVQKKPPDGGPVPAAPSVRRLAREIGVDIHAVPGTGPGGRITVEDVKEYARQVNTEVRGPVTPGLAATAPLPDFTRWGEVERQEMSSIRRRTAENLSYAWAAVPHVTQFDKADVSELEKLRKQYSKRVEEAGGKLTVTAIIVKVLAAALRRFPQFNASIDTQNNEIVLKKYYNIGIAVDTERGLLVPVVRDVDEKNIVELSVEITRLAERARNRKLALDDMQGGTFTVSNLGGIGGTAFSPVVNWPEVAILGVARTCVEPVYSSGGFEPRTMLPLALSYDHRVIDGADGARFLRWVAESLEQPFLVFLEG